MNKQLNNNEIRKIELELEKRLKQSENCIVNLNNLLYWYMMQ